MGARSDGANYGKLAVYRFPNSSLTSGPAQVESKIDAQPEVSQRISLLNVQGSHVQRGNLLLIPLADSYLYFEPVYLQADQNPNPGRDRRDPLRQQHRVHGTDPVPGTRRGLRQRDADLPGRHRGGALAAAAAQNAQARPSGTPVPGGTAAPRPAASAAPTVAGNDVAGLVREASDAEAQAQARLRAGDFAGYGEQQARLRAALDRLNQLGAGGHGDAAPLSPARRPLEAGAQTTRRRCDDVGNGRPASDAR